MDNELIETLLILQGPQQLKQYHRFMFGVDKGDQSRMHLGGFARKAHFKKWYKKSFFAILDCMLLNSLISWNLSAEMDGLERSHLQRYEFYEWIAHDFLNYNEDEVKKNDVVKKKTHEKGPTAEKVCKIIDKRVAGGEGNRICVVCRLDKCQSGTTKGLKSKTVYCETCATYIHAHELVEKRTIHEIMPGLTCHEIYKSELGREIWKKDAQGNHNSSYNHPVIGQMRKKLGLSKTTRKNIEG
jgi:hypothetical protein